LILSIGFTGKCGIERNQALPAMVGSAIAFAWSSAETKVHDWSGARRETDIASARATDVTHGSSSAGNKNAVRREKGDTMETQWAQRVDDWATWKSGRGIASLSSTPLQLAAAVYLPPRCNLIRALSHERTESALQAGPPSCFSLHLSFYLRSSLYPLLSPV